MKHLAMICGAITYVCAMGSTAAVNAAPRFALGAGFGSDGLGPNLEVELNPRLVIGARVATAVVTLHKGDKPPNDYVFTGNHRISGVSAHLDYHPWARGSRAGAIYISVAVLGGSRHGLTKGRYNGPGLPLRPGVVATAADMGEITGRVTQSKLSPVIGLGWDDSFTRRGRWGLRTFAGLALSDSDTILSAHGGIYSNDPAVAARLAPLEHTLNHDNGLLRYFPLVSVSITRRF